jgi:hypothetical protein
MPIHRILIALLAGAVSLAGCDCSGPMWGSGATLSEVSAHDARIVLVKEKHKMSGGGHFGPSLPKTVVVRFAELRVGNLRERLPEDWTDGDRVSLVASPDGDRFAYQHNDAPWRPVWRGKQHLLFGHDAQRLDVESVSWAELPTLEDAAEDLFRHTSDGAVLEEIGPRARSGILMATADEPGTRDDGWDRAFGETPPDDRKAIEDFLRTAMLDVDCDENVLARYARHVRIRSEEERRAALAILGSTKTHFAGYGTREALIAQAAQLDAPATASWACNEAQRHVPDRFFYPEALLWVMARTNTKCEAVDPQLARLSWCDLPDAALSDAELDSFLENLAGEGKGGAHGGGLEGAEKQFALRTIDPSERAHRCKGSSSGGGGAARGFEGDDVGEQIDTGLGAR